MVQYGAQPFLYAQLKWIAEKSMFKNKKKYSNNNTWNHTEYSLYYIHIKVDIKRKLKVIVKLWGSLASFSALSTY